MENFKDKTNIIRDFILQALREKNQCLNFNGWNLNFYNFNIFIYFESNKFKIGINNKSGFKKEFELNDCELSSMQNANDLAIRIIKIMEEGVDNA